VVAVWGADRDGQALRNQGATDVLPACYGGQVRARHDVRPLDPAERRKYCAFANRDAPPRAAKYVTQKLVRPASELGPLVGTQLCTFL
jgi:hypothetical protein